MTERDLLVDCLRRLNQVQIAYMLAGSMASNFWGIPRTTHDIDFVVTFEEERVGEIVARRLRVILFGEPAWIATAEDTLLHKLLWNKISPSDRQLGDAAGIIAVQGAELDRDHLERWARELDVEPVLRDLLEGKIRPKST